MYFYNMYYSLETMQDYIDKGWAINGTQGGIILGPSHDEGGVKIWEKTKEKNGYRLKGEAEGFEYILNPGATHCYRNQFSYINNYFKHKHKNWKYYDVPNSILNINTKRCGEPKFILLDANYCIVNKFSTKCYLTTIDKMNYARKYEVLDENTLKIIYVDLSPIEIYNSCTNEFEGKLVSQQD